MPGRRAEAGFRPGGRPTFLSCYKKVGKEKHPNARDPCASLRGNLRRGGCGALLRAVATLGPGLKASAAMRWLLAVGCWLLAVGCWLLAAGCWLLAAGCWLLAVLQPSPSAHACVGRDAGWQPCRRTGLLRDLTCRSCLSGARQRAASSAAHPASRPTQVARSEAKGRGQWGRASLLTFLSRDKKVSRPPGRDPASKNNHPAGSKTRQGNGECGCNCKIKNQTASRRKNPSTTRNAYRLATTLTNSAKSTCALSSARSETVRMAANGTP
ncbi:Uncharacterised protein [Delftia tsuruhatensis]|nr:Uncharacterised protein [Delftia tsuruhatensis]CAC9693175.1 Uncharacterised protein [Delftia tsuruhatensis]